MLYEVITEPIRFDDESQHEVTISRGFWMGRYEVTQAEYEEITGKKIQSDARNNFV